ncbi:Exopolyphosphatase, partial [Haplosporangium bisporale]
VDSSLLFFRDDLPRLTQIPPSHLSLFLVDHNKIADSMDMFPASKVVGLIDHHKDEDLYRDTANPRRIEVVGSCSTLVADEFFAKAFDQAPCLASDSRTDGTVLPDWAQQVSRLLLGPILIDSQNLDPARKKVTPLDQSLATRLLPYSGWDNFGDLYYQIDEARRDTSRLSAYDLLRKDYKEWVVHRATTGEAIKVGISSVVGLLNKYVARDGQEVVQAAVGQWAQDRTLDLSMVLFSEDLGETGGYQRQVLVNPVAAGMAEFTNALEAVQECELERITVVDTETFVKHGGRAYQQKNTAMSRKQIWPVVERIVTQAPPDANL